MSLETQLKVRSDGIADHLLAKKWATQVEIDACGAMDGDDPETALIVRYGDLRALLAQRAPDAGQRSERQEQVDRIVLDALRGASKAVTLTQPIGEGDRQRREVTVHPKSLNALIELAERDEVIGFYNAGIRVLRALEKDGLFQDHVDYLARAIREVAYQQQVCAWIVTHPEPGVPFRADETKPEIPPELRSLSTVDYLLIAEAHREVNAGRLAALQALPRGKRSKDDAGRGWGVYLANMASLMNRSAEQLSRDYSLAALFAQSYVHAIEQERATEKAGEK